MRGNGGGEVWLEKGVKLLADRVGGKVGGRLPHGTGRGEVLGEEETKHGPSSSRVGSELLGGWWSVTGGNNPSGGG